MKPFLALALFALCITSCMHTNNNAASQHPSIHGDWVCEKYINELKKLKSTRAAQDYAMVFSFQEKAEDTGMFVSLFHTAGGIKLFPEQGGYYYHGEYMKQGDTVEHIKFISKDTIDVCGTKFIKIIGDAQRDGNPRVAEEFLFSGTYTRENGSNVEFTANGQIKGLDTLSTYEADVDYGDEGLNLDQMIMGNNKNKNSYGFKFSNDSLYIYTLGCQVYDTTEKECAVVTYDKLLYKLCKKH